ncbi:peroxiredoxin-like 2C [Salvelinus sp. IW2-2015]|uniref:peroxiredoxin-like 2C n=1 Tax=Salvelinus sp. IW2-2015 TaxID=2691554 RepID=UPI000CDFD482|nr:thioredoxin-like protein AAED1 [Salvelinus alpinus]
MATDPPITQQITKDHREIKRPPVNVRLEDVEDCLIYDRHGVSTLFKEFYQDRKSVVIFVRNFLCHTCKEYVDDLSRIPAEVLKEAGLRLVVIGQSSHHHIESFCSLTGYPHDIYVDPERCIYKRLGMRRGEMFVESAKPSPHVKSGMLVGHMKSMWRAMTSPIFDFQGDPRQQGGAIIVGPGSEVHFAHFDMNRLDHMPINWLLQLSGVQHTLDLSDKPKIIVV